MKSPVQKVVKNYVVSASLRNLGRNHAVKSHSCNHREWVSRLLLNAFSSLQKCHLNRQAFGPDLCFIWNRKLLSFVLPVLVGFGSRVLFTVMFRQWITTYFGKPVHQILANFNPTPLRDVGESCRSAHSTAQPQSSETFLNRRKTDWLLFVRSLQAHSFAFLIDLYGWNHLLL